MDAVVRFTLQYVYYCTIVLVIFSTEHVQEVRDNNSLATLLSVFEFPCYLSVRV